MLVFAALAMVLILVGFIGIGAWIVYPLDRAARQVKAPVRFSISDFLCLFLAVQVPLTIVHLLIKSNEPGTFWTFTLASWFVGPLTWYVCAQALSRAGVSGGLHRVIFLGGVLPVVYYGLVLIVVLPFLAVGAGIGNDTQLLLAMRPWAVLWVVVAVLLIASGLYTRWLARQATIPKTDEDSETSPLAAMGDAHETDISAGGQNGSTTPPAGSSPFSGHSSHFGRLRRQ
jgi:hypothetical protein